MNGRRPYVIGIAGGTCSGKSHLAKSLEQKFPTLRLVVIHCDSYYHDLSGVEPAQRDKRNFDAPEAIDHHLLRRQVETLAAGKDIDQPVYDFVTHTRAPHVVRVEAGDVIIIEGLFALYWEELRRLMQMKVFVWLPEETGLARRLERDVLERGRTRKSVVKQYLQTVKPMGDKYILPTRAFADLVVDGTDPIEQSTLIIFDHIVSRWKTLD